jgi:hypothetical protein
MLALKLAQDQGNFRLTEPGVTRMVYEVTTTRFFPAFQISVTIDGSVISSEDGLSRDDPAPGRGCLHWTEKAWP